MNFKDQLRPGVRILVYKDNYTATHYAVVVRVNKASITIDAAGEKKRISLEAIADLAPGERDRLAFGK